MRLIDADELEARLRMQPNDLSKISVIDMVHASPTIEKRKTGRWIEELNEGYVECPFCGNLTNCEGIDDLIGLHYCFSCGAKNGRE